MSLHSKFKIWKLFSTKLGHPNPRQSSSLQLPITSIFVTLISLISVNLHQFYSPLPYFFSKYGVYDLYHPHHSFRPYCHTEKPVALAQLFLFLPRKHLPTPSILVPLFILHQISCLVSIPRVRSPGRRPPACAHILITASASASHHPGFAIPATHNVPPGTARLCPPSSALVGPLRDPIISPAPPSVFTIARQCP